MRDCVAAGTPHFCRMFRAVRSPISPVSADDSLFINAPRPIGGKQCLQYADLTQKQARMSPDCWIATRPPILGRSAKLVLCFLDNSLKILRYAPRERGVKSAGWQAFERHRAWDSAAPAAGSAGVRGTVQGPGTVESRAHSHPQS